ncbi:response regulator transcription factor [Jatrophihabitans sp.]|uniref:response regulator n=1 Tax=Jatrophihabitans sp. TaxID=1932789 RepID=UPI0030C6CC10|nr:two-component response regulator [Jatrophihabitans sp.]
MTIRVVLADDQPLLRQGFRMIVDAQPDMETVGEAADGARAVSQALALRPDVVLMDIRMPGIDGIEATRRIATELPEVKVLILTTFDLDEYAFSGLRAGASGFLLKNVRTEDCLQASAPLLPVTPFWLRPPPGAYSTATPARSRPLPAMARRHATFSRR